MMAVVSLMAPQFIRRMCRAWIITFDWTRCQVKLLGCDRWRRAKYEQRRRAETAEATRRRILDAVHERLRTAPTEPVSMDHGGPGGRSVARSTIYVVVRLAGRAVRRLHDRPDGAQRLRPRSSRRWPSPTPASTCVAAFRAGARAVRRRARRPAGAGLDVGDRPRARWAARSTGSSRTAAAASPTSPAGSPSRGCCATTSRVEEAADAAVGADQLRELRPARHRSGPVGRRRDRAAPHDGRASTVARAP